MMLGVQVKNLEMLLSMVLLRGEIPLECLEEKFNVELTPSGTWVCGSISFQMASRPGRFLCESCTRLLPIFLITQGSLLWYPYVMRRVCSLEEQSA
ncbi:hypothetical protein Cni_G00282 [Canna indica]|uniref:Uncharacterized protein n=1 Tax=Canna indica TaxID=4628 RepID=A0AAQ3JL34_9LILI|nr:hypothetical protein Cni_G00282 [Canna indica]